MSDATRLLDERMTAHRREAKYLISPEQARAVAAAANVHILAHRHTGEGANKLPAPQHYVTTIYFDTDSRALFRAATATSDSHLKLRAKEYYDLHPGLTETATDPRQLVRYQPVLWLELKHRQGEHTGKQRVGIPKRDVPAFFAQGRITEAMVQIQQTSYGARAQDVLDSVAALCASCAEPLHADCLVNYRRQAWQDETGELRITLDTGVAFYAPPSDLWDRSWALIRQTLGTPVASESRRVLELKSRGELPSWLASLLDDTAIEISQFSKFEAAASAVHG